MKTCLNFFVLPYSWNCTKFQRNGLDYYLDSIFRPSHLHLSPKSWSTIYHRVCSSILRPMSLRWVECRQTQILNIIELNLAIKMVLGYVNSSTAKAQRGTTSSAQHIRPEGILRQKNVQSKCDTFPNSSRWVHWENIKIKIIHWGP